MKQPTHNVKPRCKKFEHLPRILWDVPLTLYGPSKRLPVIYFCTITTNTSECVLCLKPTFSFSIHKSSFRIISELQHKDNTVNTRWNKPQQVVEMRHSPFYCVCNELAGSLSLFFRWTRADLWCAKWGYVHIGHWNANKFQKTVYKKEKTTLTYIYRQYG